MGPGAAARGTKMSGTDKSSRDASGQDGQAPEAAPAAPAPRTLASHEQALAVQCRELARRNAELVQLREAEERAQAELQALNRRLAAELAEHKDAEIRLESMGRLNEALSQIHWALFKIHDEPALFQKICDIAAEHGRLPLAWIGMATPDGSELRMVASAGRASTAIEGLALATDPAAVSGRTATATAMRLGCPVVVDDYLADPRCAPWRVLAESHGLGSCAAFPIRRDGRAVGSLTVYSDQRGFFDPAREALLLEVADSLSFALDTLARDAALKAVRNELIRSAQRFHRLFDEVAEGIAVLDLEQSILVDCNRAFLHLTGYARGELLGMPFALLHPEDSLAALAGQLGSVLAQGAPGRTIGTRLATRSGEVKDIEIRVNPVTLGGHRYVQGLFIDLTESRRLEREREATEEALRASEKRFRDISEAASDFLWETEPDNTISFVTERIREVLGHDPADLIGRNIYVLVPPEDAEAFHERHGVVEDFRNVEVRLLAKDGRRVWVNVTRLRKFDDQGRFRGYRGAGVEITERKRAEEAMRGDMERLQALLRVFQHQAASSQEAYELALAETLRLSGSRHGFICAFSEEPHRLEMRAWSPEVMDECRVADPGGAFMLGEAGLWGEAVRQRRPIILNRFTAPHPLKRGFPEGHVQVDNLMTVPIQVGERIVAVVGLANKAGDYDDRDLVQVSLLMGAVCRSVSLLEANESLAQSQAQVRRMNEELEQQVQLRTAQFEAANLELEAFSYSVSHDLRAPLRAMDGFSQVLLEDYGDRLDQDGRRYLQRVRQGTQRMGNLIEDLLKLSRLSRGDLETGPLDLSAQAGRILRDLALRDPCRPVETLVQPGLCATGDVRLMTIALENLLGNAWKYTALTTGARIGFGCREQDGQPVFFVQDNGAGFDMAYSGKLFSPFQRLHSDPHFEGSGIGLALVQRILHRHGGRIWAEAEPGKGATFFFTLPGQAC
jgi:hypothetical protein